MVLYRTDDFSKCRSTNIYDVLLYELFDRENESLLGNLLNVSFNDDVHKAMFAKYDTLVNEIDDKEQRLEFIKTILDYWKSYYNKDFKYAVWLYPLECVKAYVEFNDCDDMIPIIFGYDTSEYAVIKYEGEGTLYFYEELPPVKEKI